ncbi:MAG: hypothetical protein MK479_01745 [Planctomycetes bacterium]|nr:hypothetical protein [Planctomycetota bacterium]
MGRSLGLDIPEGERPLVLVDDVGGNLLVDDLQEYGAHELSYLFSPGQAPESFAVPALDLAKLKCENACA